jgi:hypothetical protein
LTYHVVYAYGDNYLTFNVKVYVIADKCYLPILRGIAREAFIQAFEYEEDDCRLKWLGSAGALAHGTDVDTYEVSKEEIVRIAVNEKYALMNGTYHGKYREELCKTVREVPDFMMNYAIEDSVTRRRGRGSGQIGKARIDVVKRTSWWHVRRKVINSDILITLYQTRG